MAIVDYILDKRYIRDDDSPQGSSFFGGGSGSTEINLETYLKRYEYEDASLGPIDVSGDVSVNGTMRVTGDILATGEIQAYSANGDIGSIWDNMPVATEDSLGGVKVDSSISDVYLDSNNVLQIDVDNIDDAGQWDTVSDGIEYNDGDVDIPNGSLTVGDNVTIQGDLTVNGTEFIVDTETVKVEDNIIVVNSGESGDGVTAGFAGIEVDRGGKTNYLSGFDESSDLFKVGKSGDLQAVTTRPDDPTDNYIARWDEANNRLKFVDTIDYDNDISNKPSIAYNDTIGLDDLDSLTTTRDISINDLLVNGQIDVFDGQSSSIFRVKYSSAGDGGYISLFDDSGDQQFVARSYSISDYQIELNKGGIKANGNSEFTGDLHVTGNITAEGEIAAYSEGTNGGATGFWDETSDGIEYTDGTVDVIVDSNRDGLRVGGRNKDVDLHLGDNNDWNEYGFHWRYKGTGTGNDNDLELWAHNITGTHKQVYNVKQNGNITFHQKVNLNEEINTDKYYAINGQAGIDTIFQEFGDSDEIEVEGGIIISRTSA